MPGRERRQGRHAAERQVVRLCQRAGGRDADAQARERPGPEPDRDRVEIGEGDARPLHHLVDRRQELGRVRGPLREPRRRRDALDQLAVSEQHGGGRSRGRGVEAEDGHSTSTVRLSPPACSRVTRCVAFSSAAGHSTNVIRSGVT